MQGIWRKVWVILIGAALLQAADSMNVYLVHREAWPPSVLPGVIRAASLGNTVYLALQLTARHGLWVVDASDPTLPRRVNTLTFDTLGTVEDIKVQNGYGYGVVSGVGLVVLDLAAPNAPTPVYTLNFPACFTDLAAVTNALLAVATCDSLLLFDLSSPDRPVLLGSGGSFDEVQEVVFYSPTHLLVADRNGLHVLDLTDPVHPQEIALVSPGQMIYDVTVSGTYAYATTANILVLDLTDPTHPAVLDTIRPTYPLGSFYRLFATPGELYGLSGGPYSPEFLVLWSLADPTNPALLDTLRVPAVPEASDLIVAEPWVYLTSGGLYALQVVKDSMGHLIRKGTCGGLHTSLSMQMAVRDTLIAFTDGVGIWFLSMPDSGALRNPGTNGHLGTTAAVSWGHTTPYLFATSSGWSSTLYILHPDSLFAPPIGQVQLSGYASQLLPLGRYLYAFGTQGLQIVDVSDPHNPTVVQSVPDLEAEAVAHRDTLLFAARGVSLEVWDISDTTSPTLLTTYPYPAVGVAVGDSLLFVGVEDSVYILSTADPLAPRQLGAFRLYWGNNARDLAFVPPYLYFHGDGSPYLTLYVLDVSDPRQPLLAGFYRIRKPGGATDLAAIGQTRIFTTAPSTFEAFGFRIPRAEFQVPGDTVSVGGIIALPMLLEHVQDSISGLQVRFAPYRMLLDSVRWTLPPGFSATINSSGGSLELTVQSTTEALPPGLDTLGILFLHFHYLVDPGDSLPIYSRWACEAWGPQGRAVPLVFHPSWVAAAPNPPQVLWPPDGSYLGTDSVEVIWSPSEGAATYRMELALDPGFQTLVDTLSTPDTTALLTNLAENRYYLRVQAVSIQGYRGDFSATLTFEVDTTGPITPELYEPVGGVWVGTAPVTFTWSPVSFTAQAPGLLAAPVRYVLQILREDTPIHTDTVDTNTASLALEEGWYRWRVQAFDLAGHASAWAGPDSFGLDLTPPVVDSLTRWADTTGFYGPWTVQAWARDTLSGVAEVWLFYRADTLPWDSAAMTLEGGAWEGMIPELPGAATVAYFVWARDRAGNPAWSDTLTFTIVSVAEETPTPGPVRLLGLWAESGRLCLRLSSPEPLSLRVRLYDIAGRNVGLWRRVLPAGARDWRIVHGLPTGLYLLRIEAGKRMWTRKLLLYR